MASYDLQDSAYLKVVLHAAKHPHRTVNGVLLGTIKGQVVRINDSVPLLHHWTSLSPMMEIGLDLAETYAKSQSLSLVGYYQVTSSRTLFPADSLGPVGEKVVGKIMKNFPSAIAIAVDGDKLGAGDNPLTAFLPTSPSSSVFRPAPSSVLQLPPSSVATALRAVREEHLQEKFGDFDDHLEDVSIDWLRNTAVTASAA